MGEIMKFDFTAEPGKTLKPKLYNKKVKPLISIVTPFYNAGQYFEQTFNSILNQSFPWFEWIIINDGSTKKEDVVLLKKLAATDSRITVIDTANQGVSEARNTGIRKTTTDIFVPIDADDIVEPTYLEVIYWGLYFNPKAAWCYTDSVGFQQMEYTWKVPWNAANLLKSNFLRINAAIRKKDCLEIGGYKTENFNYHEDWRFWLEMLAAGKTPVHVGSILDWYRRLETGRYSSVMQNEEFEKKSDEVIRKAAEKVDTSIKAVEYPVERTAFPYHKPKAIEWPDEYVIEKENCKIRILMLIPWMVMGGADKFNLDLIANLDSEKYEISVMTTVNSENEWKQRFLKYTDEIFCLPEFLDPAYYYEFVDYYIKSRKIDTVLVTNSMRGYYMIPMLRKNFPEISIIDYVHMEEWYWKAGGFARVSGMFGKFLDKTYVCNSATRTVLIDEFGRAEESVDTMYIGVDHELFDEKKVHAGYLYEKLGLSKNKKIVLFPCRIHPQKRPFMLLNIAKKVNVKDDSIVFVVVGDGEQLDELKSQIHREKLDNIVFCIGRSDKMQECYKDASVTLICSLKEGLALTAYESCAMGTPVISSNVGGQKDLIDENVGALIDLDQSEEKDYDNRQFDQQEVQQYADKIIYILQNESVYRIMSENCRRKIETEFSLKKMSERMSAEIQSHINSLQCTKIHKTQSEMLKAQGNFAEEMYTTQLALEEREMLSDKLWKKMQTVNISSIENADNKIFEITKVLRNHEKVLNRHEEVVNRHEEVVNRHEEVVNRHENVVNDDWRWLKDLEKRVSDLEKKSFKAKIKQLLQK